LTTSTKKKLKNKMPNLQTSLVFAQWIVENGKALIDHYYGVNFDVETGRFEESEIPVSPVEQFVPRDNHELQYWLNNAIMMIKTLTRLFHHRLTEDLADFILPLDDYDTDISSVPFAADEDSI
jgi:hypothetical protein